MLLRMLGNRAFVAMPNIPQHVDGMSSKLVISLLANESSRGQLLERLPLGQRQRLNERALASMACESAFSEGSNCGRKPGPDVMDPQIARIAWVHEESYKLPEVRGYALPECSGKSVYNCSHEEGANSTWGDGSYAEREAKRRKDACKAATSGARVRPVTVRTHFKMQ